MTAISLNQPPRNNDWPFLVSRYCRNMLTNFSGTCMIGKPKLLSFWPCDTGKSGMNYSVTQNAIRLCLSFGLALILALSSLLPCFSDELTPSEVIEQEHAVFRRPEPIPLPVARPQIEVTKEAVHHRRVVRRNHFYTRVRVNGRWYTRNKPKRRSEFIDMNPDHWISYANRQKND